MTSSRLKVVCALRAVFIITRLVGEDKKEADKSSQPLFLTLQTNQFFPLSSFFACSIWYFTCSKPVPPKEFRL